MQDSNLLNQAFRMVLNRSIRILHSTSYFMVDQQGIEPWTVACKATVLPLALRAHISSIPKIT